MVSASRWSGWGLDRPLALGAAFFGAWLPSARRAGLREVSHLLSGLLFAAEHLFGQSLRHCSLYLRIGGSLGMSSSSQWHRDRGRLKAPTKALSWAFWVVGSSQLACRQTAPRERIVVFTQSKLREVTPAPEYTETQVYRDSGVPGTRVYLDWRVISVVIRGPGL